ncbi:MAG: ROK family protein [Geminicoccaceae bacterium]
MPVIAIDLGGTNLRAALVEDGQVLQRHALPTRPADGAESWLEAIARLAAPWSHQATALGVSVTGIVRGGRWTAINPEVLPVPAGLPLVRELRRRTGLPVVAVNDGHAAAWGEFRRGAGQGHRSMLYMTVSTGIGGGLVLDGRLRRGATGLAGSVGHLLADPGGPPCGCGKRGCLEAVASGSALAAIAAAQGHAGPVRAGEPWAEALLERSAAAVARALVDLQTLLDVEVAVVGGGLGLSAGYLPRVATAMLGLPGVFRPPLLPAGLGDDAGLVGAALLAAVSRARRAG